MRRQHTPDTGLRLLSYLGLPMTNGERAMFRFFWPSVQDKYNVFQWTAILYAAYIPQAFTAGIREPTLNRKLADDIQQRSKNFTEALEKKPLRKDFSRTKSLYALLKEYGDVSLN